MPLTSCRVERPVHSVAEGRDEAPPLLVGVRRTSIGHPSLALVHGEPDRLRSVGRDDEGTRLGALARVAPLETGPGRGA